MRNITLSADEHLIESACRVARAKKTTLNQAFQEWLESYAQSDAVELYRELMKRINYAHAGRKFTREEMNS